MRKWPALMLDCETLSTRPNALILQLAALPFDADAPLHEPCHGTAAFDVYLDWSKCEIEANACHIDIGTVQWWLVQSIGAQNRLAHGKPRLDAMKAADEFAWFLKEQLLPGATIWSYGAAADIVWVRHFMRIAGYPDPWSYRVERCLRTVAGKIDSPAPCRPETPHDALSDAVAQANWLRNARAPYDPCVFVMPDGTRVAPQHADEAAPITRAAWEALNNGFKPNYVLALGGDS